jgi:hypothetical protein
MGSMYVEPVRTVPKEALIRNSGQTNQCHVKTKTQKTDLSSVSVAREDKISLIWDQMNSTYSNSESFVSQSTEKTLPGSWSITMRRAVSSPGGHFRFKIPSI